MEQTSKKKVPPLKDLKVGQIIKMDHWWRGSLILEVLETKKIMLQQVPTARPDEDPYTIVRLYAVKTRSIKPLPGVYKNAPVEQQIVYIFKSDYFEIISNNSNSARILYG